MLVSCAYCNGIHKRGNKCKNRSITSSRKKEETFISRFRSTRKWQLKRAEVKTRDKFLCQVCLLDGKYNFHNLQVHHITPISKDWNKRLDEYNLVTLCHFCHKLAEDKEIQAEALARIARKNADAFKGV